MALTDYTTYVEVRATLGVSDKELTDVTLSLDMYGHALVADLEDIGLNLPTDFATVLGMNEDERTGAQQRFYSAVRLFSPYAVAVQLASSLPLFAPKSLTDGKAGFSRDANSPYKTAIENARQQFDRNRQRLADRYGDFVGGATAAEIRPYFTVVTPAIDPVTGA
jgi:hypothetical protein